MASLNRELLVLALAALALFFNPSIAKPTFTPFLPPSYPLAVRNPYLSGESVHLHSSEHVLTFTSLATWQPSGQSSVCSRTILERPEAHLVRHSSHQRPSIQPLRRPASRRSNPACYRRFRPSHRDSYNLQAHCERCRFRIGLLLARVASRLCSPEHAVQLPYHVDFERRVWFAKRSDILRHGQRMDRTIRDLF